jgi:hypothetical protein
VRPYDSDCAGPDPFLLDLHKLGLWEPLHALVTAEKSTPNIQVHALWVIGTAVQHNPIAQDVVSVPRCQRETKSFLKKVASIYLSVRSLSWFLYLTFLSVLIPRSEPKSFTSYLDC